MSLSEPYTLTKIPRLSTIFARAKICSQSTSDELHVGISGSSISQFLLKPSPKLLWSHSLPPSQSVTAISLKDEVYCCGLYDKTSKKNKVLLVKRIPNDSQVLKEFEVSSRVLDTCYDHDGGLVVVSENGVVAYDDEFGPKWENKSLYKSVFSEKIEDHVLLVIEHDVKAHKLNLKLVNIDNGVEINSKILEFNKKQNLLKDLQFTYSKGVLYQYSKETIQSYQLPTFQSLKQISLNEIIMGFQIASNFQFQSPLKDRLIITNGNELFLINTKFNIILDSINNSKKPMELLFIETPQSSHFKSLQQLFGVLLKEDDIQGFTYSLDSNTLKDAIGKKYNMKEDEKFYQVTSIMDIKEEEINIREILQTKDFDFNLLKFLEAKNDYYTEMDKTIDSRLMQTIVNYIFEAFEEIPERSMTYLLTHPLFPIVDGLLSKLRSKPRLLRQAIVTGNVSIEELMKELELTDNEEIFKDVVIRILEFPRDKLQFKDLDNFKIVEKIINLNFGYELISLLIDSSGLFTWNEELINKLSLVLEDKIDALNSSSKILAVLDQIEMKNLKTVKRVPVYSIEKLTI